MPGRAPGSRSWPEGLKVQEAIRGAGGEATFIYCDVTDSKAVGASVDEVVSTYGGVNLLINNAGAGTGGFFPDEADDTFDATVRLNLYGTFYMSKAVWPHLVEAGGGAIIKDTRLATDLAKELSVPLLHGAATEQAWHAGEARGPDKADRLRVPSSRSGMAVKA